MLEFPVLGDNQAPLLFCSTCGAYATICPGARGLKGLCLGSQVALLGPRRKDTCVFSQRASIRTALLGWAPGSLLGRRPGSCLGDVSFLQGPSQGGVRGAGAPCRQTGTRTQGPQPQRPRTGARARAPNLLPRRTRTTTPSVHFQWHPPAAPRGRPTRRPSTRTQPGSSRGPRTTLGRPAHRPGTESGPDKPANPTHLPGAKDATAQTPKALGTGQGAPRSRQGGTQCDWSRAGNPGRAPAPTAGRAEAWLHSSRGTPTAREGHGRPCPRNARP
jgi:hypothetical protein